MPRFATSGMCFTIWHRYDSFIWHFCVGRNILMTWKPFPHYWATSLLWRHNEHDSVSNHQPHDCLLNRLFRRRLKKTSKLRVTGLCVGNSPGPVNSPHKGPVKRKMFPFDDVIMCEGNPPVTCKLPSQSTNDVECVSMWSSSWLNDIHII